MFLMTTGTPEPEYIIRNRSTECAGPVSTVVNRHLYYCRPMGSFYNAYPAELKVLIIEIRKL